MKSFKLLAIAAALIAPIAAQAAPGLNGRYYAGTYGNGPNGTYGTPTATFNTNTVCFPSCGGGSGDGDTLSSFLGVPAGYTTNLSTDFNGLNGHTLFLDGYLNIATTGSYTLGTYSDDGSLLYIDGNLVVNNGGDHGLVNHTGTVNLTAGSHTLRIFQEENGGGTGLTAYFVNPDSSTTALGGSFLSTTGGVPEPSQWALMLGGFAFAGAAMRRRRTTMATVTA
jgi:hypothetical protein